MNSKTEHIITYCLVTCLYIPAVIIFLVYFNLLYEIGNINSYPLLLGLTFAEFLKFAIVYKIKNPRNYINKKHASFKHIIKFIVVFCGMTILFYVIAVLFGAQVFSEQEQTLMFALLLAVLSVFPSCLNLGTDKTLNIFSELVTYKDDVLTDFILMNIRCTFIGAWMGAFVIPLDWDRPWQVWPIPCCLGSLIGYFSSHFFTLCIILNKKTAIFGKKTGKYGL